jgi:hypothetical protein
LLIIGKDSCRNGTIYCSITPMALLTISKE